MMRSIDTIRLVEADLGSRDAQEAASLIAPYGTDASSGRMPMDTLRPILTDVDRHPPGSHQLAVEVRAPLLPRFLLLGMQKVPTQSAVLGQKIVSAAVIKPGREVRDGVTGNPPVREGEAYLGITHLSLDGSDVATANAEQLVRATAFLAMTLGCHRTRAAYMHLSDEVHRAFWQGADFEEVDVPVNGSHLMHPSFKLYPIPEVPLDTSSLDDSGATSLERLQRRLLNHPNRAGE